MAADSPARVLVLSRALRKLGAALLRRASEEFANHGCNDYRLDEEAGLTQAEATELRAEVTAWLRRGDPQAEEVGAVTCDFLLMDFMAAMLEETEG